MKEEFKRCLKLIKYSYNYKDECASSVVLFFLGVIFFLVSWVGGTVNIGVSLMLVGTPTLFVKALDSLSASYMVCSSKRHKFMELTFRNVWAVGATILGYLVWILLSCLLLDGTASREAEVAGWIMWSCLFHSIFICLTGIYKKYYWQAVLALIPVFFVYILAYTLWDEAFAGFTKFGPAAVIGFIITLAAVLLSCVLRVLVYKKPPVRGTVGKKMLSEM